MTDETESDKPADASSEATSETSENAAGAENGDAAAQAGPPLQILHQYVKDLSFENPSTPKIQPKADSTANVKIDVTATALAEGVFEVAIHSEFRAEQAVEDKNETLYMGELVYAGLVRLGQVRQQDIEPLLLIETPRTLFPFARAVISNAVRDGGFPPMLLAPFDFAELFRRRLAARAEAKKAEGATDPGTDASSKPSETDETPKPTTEQTGSA